MIFDQRVDFDLIILLHNMYIHTYGNNIYTNKQVKMDVNIKDAILDSDG